jgi:hypothetical protein
VKSHEESVMTMSIFAAYNSFDAIGIEIETFMLTLRTPMRYDQIRSDEDLT